MLLHDHPCVCAYQNSHAKYRFVGGRHVGKGEAKVDIARIVCETNRGYVFKRLPARMSMMHLTILKG